MVLFYVSLLFAITMVSTGNKTLIHRFDFSNLETRRVATMGINREMKERFPKDLVLEVHAFISNNDWLSLENTFHRTERTHSLLTMLEESRRTLRRNKFTKIRCHRENEKNYFIKMAELDEKGNIIRLDLRFQGLTDDDIRDFSKLPPKLMEMDLSQNHFCKIDLKSLPKTLRSLHLVSNELPSIALRYLPDGLQILHLTRNNMTELDLNHRPRSLWYVDVRGMNIKQLNLDSLELIGSTLVGDPNAPDTMQRFRSKNGALQIVGDPIGTSEC